MKTSRSLLVAFLIIMWSSYIVWEYFTQKWVHATAGPIIRADLVVLLPILITTTYFIIKALLKKEKTK